MGIFNRRKNVESKPAVAEQSAVEETKTAASSVQATEKSAEPVQTVEPGSGLHSLVELMRSRAEGDLTVDLKQTGNDMNLGFFVDGDEKESTVVVPGSEWFDAVAALYTDEEKSERGAFSRALIKVAGPVVEASFINGTSGQTHNLRYGASSSEKQQEQTDVAESQQTEKESVERPETSEPESNSTAGSAAGVAAGAGAVAVGTGVAVDSADDSVEKTSASDETFNRIGSRLNSAGENSAEEKDESFEQVAFGQDANRSESESATSVDEEKPEYVSASDLPTAEEAIAAREAREAARRQDSETESEAEIDDEESAVAENSEIADNIESADLGSSAEAEATEVTAQTDSQFAESSHQSSFGKATDMPTYVDDDFVSDEDDASVNPVFAGTATAGAATVAGATAVAASSSQEENKNDSTVAATPTEGVTDLPQNAEAYDVAPSYNKPAQPVAKPSTTAKAEGNLVLTEADVVSRLAGAQEALFGANGTARDVSTVLIRIRALGSYYDALTHVRAGGFWDQKKTFELVPEDVLNVLQLKADSYQEGFGSPLAISLRFTPGIPPVASFDYSNEEAFVQYSDHLPAQQYVEELRMFPRTGSNIPDHMNEALTSWSF